MNKEQIKNLVRTLESVTASKDEKRVAREELRAIKVNFNTNPESRTVETR